MIYWGPSFLAVVWFGPSPTPSPVNEFDQRHNWTKEDWERETTCWREKKGSRGWERSRIIRPQESLFFFKSFKKNSLVAAVERWGGGGSGYIFTAVFLKVQSSIYTTYWAVQALAFSIYFAVRRFRIYWLTTRKSELLFPYKNVILDVFFDLVLKLKQELAKLLKANTRLSFIHSKKIFQSMIK